MVQGSAAKAPQYEVLEKIGHGSFGIIRKVRRKDDGQILCRKEINYVRMSPKERDQLHAEFMILSGLRHPNIVGYYHREHLKASQDLHLYMEYCGNGDLGRYINDLKRKRTYADEGFVWTMFSQLVTALYRCHYGIDPPEVGNNLGLGQNAKPKLPPPGTMILHRDLKPENVFLGEDNSVKLGDFGLSKVMASHDFASTYVGTPFYMSPEICAAERYTLKSDIWSLGCIMYELCAKEPPFNAKSHIELVQRIRDGRIAPLPPCYSPDVTAVIKDCLKVNPDRRPDTATLLNLPIVKLMRKEKEVVEVRKLLAKQETILAKKVQEADDRHRLLEAEKAQMRQEIDASVRREWEVKATLEIERQVEMRVQAEMNRLRHRFDIEVKQQVEEGIQKFIERQTQATTTPELYSNEDKLDPSSSVGTSGDGDSTSTTELTELSALSIRDSPAPTRRFEPGTRTPLSRAQTMHAAPPTPMDIEMSEPSPAPSMDALSLSPRRKAPAAQRNNIFKRAVLNHAVESEETLKDLEASDDDDDNPLELSPTRSHPARSNPMNPFKPAGGRPALIPQKTAPLHKLPANGAVSNPNNIFHQNQNGNSKKTAPTMAAKQVPILRPAQSISNLRERERSPAASPRHRRASKIPSSNALNTAFNAASESPSRKTSATSAKKVSHSSRPMSMPVAPRGASADGDYGVTENVDHNGDPIKTHLKSRPATGSTAAGVKGRTLVELSQARAGGRPIDSFGEEYMASPNTKRYNQAAKMQAQAAKEEKEARQAKEAKEEPKEDPFAPAVWDPEVMGDDMPSPFVVRTRGRGGVSR